MQQTKDYTIYTFDVAGGGTHWKRHSSEESLETALLAAQNLYATKKYRKIEVKKKTFDPRHCVMRDKIVKIYGRDDGRFWRGLKGVLSFFLKILSAFTAGFFEPQKS